MTPEPVRGAVPHVPVVVRQRLIDLLSQRFEARLTIVVGGGGSGKTTALAQAMRAETERLDVWYPATIADRDRGRLLDGLTAATSAADGQPIRRPGDPLGRLADLVLSAAPRQVCLVIDDVHVLSTGEAIDAIVGALPANGHVLVAGRRMPKLATARLDAAGLLAEIDQHDLLMTPAELVEFANLRGVDVERLDGAAGWPAFVELASTGAETRTRRYLEQEAVAALAPQRRAALAAFAAVGGGDDEIALAATGMPLETLVAALPLVRWSGEVAQLHDLWGELLATELEPSVRDAAIGAAATVHRRRGEFDRAIVLNASVEAWDDVIASLAQAIRDGVDGGLRADQLTRWRRSLPTEYVDHPVAVLIDGVIERERDPTADSAFSLFDRAARGFADSGQPELELIALTQLGYLARVGGDPSRIEPVMQRLAALSVKHPPALPFLAFGEAWRALAIGRPDLQLAALEGITDDQLPAVWRISRDHLIAHALFNLGRPDEALQVVPTEIDTLPVPIPGALVTESQCYWYAGQPDIALAVRPAGLSNRHGARDRFIAGAWIAMMHSYTGHLDRAREAARIAELSVGEQSVALLAAQLTTIQLLIKLGGGDEDGAAADLAAVLEFVPLGGGVAEQYLRNNLTIPYVLVPSTREYWDHAELGPSQIAAREVAHAFVSAREDGDTTELSSMHWPEPGFIAANFPVRWATELALRGVQAGRHEGRLLVGWLCEHWGEPARRALRSWLDDDLFDAAAADVVAKTPTPPGGRVEVQLLGPLDLRLDGLSTAAPDWRRERVRALLAWLVLNPVTTRDRTAGALWPDLSIDRAAKNLRTTLNYLNGVLEPRRTVGDATWFVRVDGQQLRLHNSLDVDLRRFRGLLDAADRSEREGHPNESLELLRDALGQWSGDLATDLDHDWLDLERIHVRSRFVRASCRAAELLVATGRAGDAIETIRPALAIDPWHEPSYLALADAYTSLGDATSARAIIDRAEEQLGALTTPAGIARASRGR